VLAIVQRNAQIQAKLIDDLLDMNRLMAGNVRMELTPVDIAATVQATLQSLQPAAAAKRLELAHLIEAPAIAVLADAARLQQVLWNLLHNAIKFTPAGGRVDVRVGKRDGHVSIVVQDTGHGITREFLPHVFERFRQQDSSTTREAPGLGLGLSIAKHLVELHGGTIRGLSDGEGTGATFIVELPAAPERQAASAGLSRIPNAGDASGV
jgi:signal transduction histidine kinase